jgi:hypothetical protein
MLLIIRMPTLIHSSFYVLSFLFSACRQNFVDAAVTVPKAELAYNINVN